MEKAELTLEHATMISKWFNLPERTYKTLDLDTLQAIVQLHFPEYQDYDIKDDLKAILA